MSWDTYFPFSKDEKLEIEVKFGFIEVADGTGLVLNATNNELDVQMNITTKGLLAMRDQIDVRIGIVYKNEGLGNSILVEVNGEIQIDDNNTEITSNERKKRRDIDPTDMSDSADTQLRLTRTGSKKSEISGIRGIDGLSGARIIIRST